jgi:CheY-like chemotaxis protein
VARILIIDDDEIVRELLVLWLQTKGNECLQAGDGAAGLALLRSNPPDLVVLDMRMPTMDGLSFLRAAQEIGPKLPPVLVLSATKFDRVDFPQSKSRIEFLRKPASAAAVLAAIEDILEGR